MEHQDLTKLKVTELRELLKARGLNSVGNKQELIDRLQLAFESSSDLDFKLEDELLNDDEEQSLLDSTQDDLLKSPSGSTKSTSPDNSNSSAAPSKPISLKRNISVAVPVVDSTLQSASTEVSTDDTTGSTDEPIKKVVKLSEMSADERLALRAKKFGISAAADAAPTTEKLQARAARFGIQSESVSSTTTPAKSLEVLKKRAERFGAVLVPELKKVEVEEKLLKRQERFGAVITTTTDKIPITGPKTNLSENDEKKLKRMERFKTAA